MGDETHLHLHVFVATATRVVTPTSPYRTHARANWRRYTKHRGGAGHGVGSYGCLRRGPAWVTGGWDYFTNHGDTNGGERPDEWGAEALPLSPQP
jgi:hypothetical protein